VGAVPPASRQTKDTSFSDEPCRNEARGRSGRALPLAERIRANCPGAWAALTVPEGLFPQGERALQAKLDQTPKFDPRCAQLVVSVFARGSGRCPARVASIQEPRLANRCIGRPDATRTPDRRAHERNGEDSAAASLREGREADPSRGACGKNERCEASHVTFRMLASLPRAIRADSVSPAAKAATTASARARTSLRHSVVKPVPGPAVVSRVSSPRALAPGPTASLAPVRSPCASPP